MKLENRFTVPVPVDEAWRVLLDVERIAPCMPGATLTSRDGDAFEGKVKVKVGPINLTYGGTARFVSKDETNHVAVIDGSGKETRGTGTAKALITCRLLDKGATTDVEVDTDLSVTGKPAQFGRGVLADVSAKLVDQFAACLSEEIRAGTPAGDPAVEPVFAATAADLGTPEALAEPAVGMSAEGSLGGPDGGAGGAAPQPPAPRPARQSADAIDLLDAAGAPVLKRLAPVLAALVVLLLVLRRRRG
ncbi:MAG TPA: SRPBCC family protein [Mycobacteriales bacterium]|nr:SRPBCC family protein [Mycobacteriales bacterium]